MAMPLNNVSKVDTKEEPEIYQENITETNKVVPFSSQVTPIKTVIALPKVAKMVSQLPAWQVIDKKNIYVDSTTQHYLYIYKMEESLSSG